MPKEAVQSPVNPYQSPVPEDFMDEKSRQYELAQLALEGLIVGLRDRVKSLEEENKRLKRGLVAQAAVFGIHMEGADID